MLIRQARGYFIEELSHWSLSGGLSRFGCHCLMCLLGFSLDLYRRRISGRWNEKINERVKTWLIDEVSVAARRLQRNGSVKTKRNRRSSKTLPTEHRFSRGFGFWAIAKFWSPQKRPIFTRYPQKRCWHGDYKLSDWSEFSIWCGHA